MESPMSDPGVQAQVEAARAYEALFVPAVFGQWAAVVANAMAVTPSHRILDIACGTGALTRVLQSRVGQAGRVSGLDPNVGMLAVAKELAPAIDWHQGSAESLPFPDNSFDSVASQFGLMFFLDRERALREALRVLRPGGRLAVLVWGELHSMPAYLAEVGMLDRLAGKAAADALRAPFVLGDAAGLADMFASAGSASVEIKAHRGTARFPGIRVMVEADLRGWLPVMGVSLEEEVINRVLSEAEDVLSVYQSQAGVTFELQALLVTASKPE